MIGECSLCERVYAAVVIFLLFDLKKRDAPTDASRLKKSCFAPYCSTGESKPSFRKPFCTSGWLMKSRHNNSERWFSIITAIGP